MFQYKQLKEDINKLPKDNRKSIRFLSQAMQHIDIKDFGR